MPLQNFVDKVGPVVSSAWLNLVDTLTFTIFGDATTKAQARTNLTSDAPLEVVNGGTGLRTTAAGGGGTRTAGEIAAGVTPTDFTYPPGNVLRYGADPAGSADSTTAVNNAALSNLTVIFPPGTYKVTSVTFASRAVTLQGSGRGSTFIVASGSSDTFAWNGAAVAGGGCYDMTITGTGKGGGNLISNGNNGNNTGQNRWTLSNLSLIDGYDGIYVADWNLATLDNIWINGTFTSGATGYAIKVFGSTPSSNAVIDMHNVSIGFSAAPSATSPRGIWLDGSASTIDLLHVGIVNAGYGLYVTNSLNNQYGVQFITAYDLQVDTSYNHCIYMTGGTGQSTTHHFTDLYVHASATGAGMYIESSVTFVTVQAGIFITNHNQGIYANGRYCKFMNLQVSINSQVGIGTFPAVQFGANSISNELIGSLAGTWSGFANGNTSYGLQIDAGAVLYAAVGNDFAGNTVGDINDLANNFSRSFVGNRTNFLPTTQAVLEGGATVGYAGNPIRHKQKGQVVFNASTTLAPGLSPTLPSNGISGITKAANAVITISTVSTLNPYLVGMVIVVNTVAGMVEINGVIGTVTALGGVSGAWTVTTNINSSGFTPYGSGGGLMVNYQVILTANATGGPFWVTGKSGAGFTINSSAPFTGVVDWILEQ